MSKNTTLWIQNAIGDGCSDFFFFMLQIPCLFLMFMNVMLERNKYLIPLLNMNSSFTTLYLIILRTLIQSDVWCFQIHVIQEHRWSVPLRLYTLEIEPSTFWLRTIRCWLQLHDILWNRVTMTHSNTAIWCPSQRHWECTVVHASDMMDEH